ncbi:translocase of chloroplast 159, chloroplastic [Tanacetum coccineum]
MRDAHRPPRYSMFKDLCFPVTEMTELMKIEVRKETRKVAGDPGEVFATHPKIGTFYRRVCGSTGSVQASTCWSKLQEPCLGRQTGQAFRLDAAKQKATELEADGSDDLDFGLNILAIGKAGVGKSATINSIFGEDKTSISAFQPATSSVKEISDAQTIDHNDFPLLKTITTSLGPAIWKSVIVTLTHGASAPPEGSNGLTLSYEMFVIQRSHIVQQAISQAVGDMRMMSPSLMNPVSLSRPHPKLSNDQDGTESDAYLADLTESDNEEDDDEYDQLPPFKPLKISQVSMLRKELKKTYFNERLLSAWRAMMVLRQSTRCFLEVPAMKSIERRGHTNYDPDTSMCSVPIVKDATDVAIATVMSGIQVRIYYSLWFIITFKLHQLL